VAYKLDLPPANCVHSVFHTLQRPRHSGIAPPSFA
jgi:hypothetical protein